jgi:hypothetical protein
VRNLRRESSVIQLACRLLLDVLDQKVLKIFESQSQEMDRQRRIVPMSSTTLLSRTISHSSTVARRPMDLPRASTARKLNGILSLDGHPHLAFTLKESHNI